MISNYENVDYLPSATASGGKCSQYRGTCPKWTKVLLIVLGLSLVFALGGLCALWVLYKHTLADFESLNKKHIMVSMQLKEKNDTIITDQSCHVSVDRWVAFCGKLYLFSSYTLNWSSSRAFCNSKGADLVTITNHSEQGFLFSKMKETHWIGLNDLETEGHWVWVNNQSLKETGAQFWFSGDPSQPDNWRYEDPSGENCAALGDENGNFQSWFDASCKKNKKFICEKKFTPISDTS